MTTATITFAESPAAAAVVPFAIAATPAGPLAFGFRVYHEILRAQGLNPWEPETVPAVTAGKAYAMVHRHQEAVASFWAAGYEPSFVAHFIVCRENDRSRRFN